jgi:hypothetical protein
MLAAQDLIVTIAALGAGALLLRRTVFAPSDGDDPACPRCDSGGTCHPTSTKPAEPEVRPLVFVKKN